MNPHSIIRYSSLPQRRANGPIVGVQYRPSLTLSVDALLGLGPNKPLLGLQCYPGKSNYKGNATLVN